uniref:Serine/arginine repetitive matrix protein 2 n=1 Tax=Schistosoma japonicum TaxID=6182 RepID=C1LE07_SCHJA|nr:Serine/arginine repetitive matrix protein 2 [Schistosoma japonicum]
MDLPVISALHCLESDHHEQLDFEDENLPINNWDSEILSLRNNKRCRKISASSSSSESSESSAFDEGEMRSSDESDSSKDEHSSEEGEVQSEIDEVEGTADTIVKKDETPWERGLRLARERLERAKALKAKEKNLAEKRMNLPVPAPAVDKKIETSLEDEFLWPCYYQAYIIGRTELTGHRYLPEDILPPSASETAEWRRRVTKYHRSRHRRRSASQRSASSSSSSVSSSSRSSSHSSATSSSISSLASVAVSWKETCAKAMKPYLRSPRRHRKYDSRHSSATNSRSSDSESGSGRSRSYPTAASGARSGALTDRGRSYWGAGKHRGRNIESGNSSGSRSGSKSSAGSRGRTGGGNQTWFGGAGGRSGDLKVKTGRRSKSPASPPRQRTDVPPLPNERPVKRPWVVAPSLATAQNVPKGDGHIKEHSRSSSRSPSPSGKDTGEKRYITSWSRSPSSGGETGHDVHHRERLPDVVPGPHVRTNRRVGVGASPLRRKKSRSPFADDATRPTEAVVNWAPKTINYSGEGNMSNSQTNINNNQTCPLVSEHIGPDGYHPNNTDMISNTLTPTQTIVTGGGELPPNRPGVRLTLAPRMKAAPVGISSLANPAPSRSTANRLPPQMPSPPPQSRQVRPPGAPVLHRHTSPIDPNRNSTVGPNTVSMSMTQTQVRLQAEAAAAALEIRERRRAAAEAANKRRQPRRHKRTDIESIPVRGRPTYRRKSFSASSEASGSSSSSNSSRSPSGGHLRPALNRQAPPSKQDQEVVRPSGRKRVHDTQRTSLKEIDENTTTRRHVGRPVLLNSIDPREPLEYGRYAKQPDFNDRSIHRIRGSDQFVQKPVQSMKRPYPSGPDVMPVRQRPERESRMTNARYPNQSVDEPHRVEPRRTAASQFNMATKERIVRPRTPHGLEMIDFSRRSPHAAEVDILPKIIRIDREQYRRVNYDIPDVSACEKQSSIDSIMIDSTDNFGAKRARSRHRSRGPGVIIDRSEPFESDTGSFAAEQRLRKLRERLNLVDDAIAEIKAGTVVQSNFNFGDIRRP